MKRPIRFLLPALLGVALVAALALHARTTVEQSRDGVAPRPSESSRRLVAEGRLAAYPGAEVVVSTEVPGTIVELPVEELAAVRRGEPIVRLRADDLRAERAEALARIAEAEAEIRLAEVELERARNLYDRQIDTRTRLDRAERDLEVFRARAAAARAAVVRIDAELAKHRIAAPIDGVVIARNVDPGETVEARMPIVTLADLSRLRIEAEVDEFDAGRVALGDPVIVTAEGWAGESWRGTVEEIPDAVSGRRLKPQDPGRPSDTRVLIVKVRLAEPTPLKLGQRVEVEIGG